MTSHKTKSWPLCGERERGMHFAGSRNCATIAQKPGRQGAEDGTQSKRITDARLHGRREEGPNPANRMPASFLLSPSLQGRVHTSPAVHSSQEAKTQLNRPVRSPDPKETAERERVSFQAGKSTIVAARHAAAIHISLPEPCKKAVCFRPGSGGEVSRVHLRRC